MRTDVFAGGDQQGAAADLELGPAGKRTDVFTGGNANAAMSSAAEGSPE